MHPGAQFLKLPDQAAPDLKVQLVNNILKILVMRAGGSIEIENIAISLCARDNPVLNLDINEETGMTRVFINEKVKDGQETEPAQ